MSKEHQIESADRYLEEGKYAKAVKIFEKLADKEPDDLRLRLKLADAYMKQKAIAKAIEMYQAVASVYEKEKFHLKAIAIYKLILKMNPTLINVNERLGDLYAEVGLRQDALGQYMIVASHLEQLNDIEHLLEIREKVVKVEPETLAGHVRLAEMYQRVGRIEESTREYEYVAAQMKERGETSGLPEVYQKLLFYNPDQPELLQELCRLYLQKGDAQKALERLESIPPVLREEPDLKELLIRTYLKLEQRENARHLIRELYTICGNNHDGVRAARLYALAHREFEDDVEYLEELDAIRQETGLKHEAQAVPEREAPAEAVTVPPVATKPSGLHEKVSEADLEKTTIVRLEEPAPSVPQPGQPEGVDLEKTAIFHEEDIKPKSPEPEEDIKVLEETVMVDLAEFEKYMKEKKS